MKTGDIKKFQILIWDFYEKNKRNFPWRGTKNPYKILVSEIMLQQTQTDRVVRYYERFLKKFPDIQTLAKANFSDLYEVWQGLGYNRRAMYLKKTAEAVVSNHKGKLPKTVEKLEKLPGIGPYTARAVAAFAYDIPVACIETNIRRVYIHHFFPKAEKVSDNQILAVAVECLDHKNPREWNWALMDYGAFLKTQVENPNRRHKNYTIQPKFEGSLRQIRGAALRMLSGKPTTTEALTKNIQKLTKQSPDRIANVLASLEKEGFVAYDSIRKTYSLN